jgi:ATP-dependent DNA ligase
MVKVKHAREADVVVAGWREHKNSTPERPLLGSLQLGLYDDAGVLHFVGVAAAFPEARRAELAAQFAPVTLPEGEGEHPWRAFEVEGRRPGMVSRWSPAEIRQTNLIWPMLVAEVGYEHMEGTRFRHTAQFRRWRPDREPASSSSRRSSATTWPRCSQGTAETRRDARAGSAPSCTATRRGHRGCR